MHVFAAVVLGIALIQPSSHAQAPTTLAAMRDHFRPLLIFTGGDAKPAEQQLTEIASHAAEARDRQILLVGVQGTAKNIRTVLLPPAEEERAERRFQINPGQFTVILLGKDGSEKLRSHTPISWSKLQSTIDAMPMRQAETRSHQP